MIQTKIQTWLGRAAKKPGDFKAWLLLLVGIISAAALPIFSPQTAQAQAANVYVDRGLFEDVTAKIYRDAIATCVDQNGTIPATDAGAIVDGRWFSSGKAVVGPLLDSEDERRNCETAYLVNEAMSAFGWENNNTQAACSLGLMITWDPETGDEDSSCVPGKTNYIPPQNSPSPHAVQDAIDRHRFFDPLNPGDQTPGFAWTDPQRYIYYARSFEIGCRANPIADWESATNDQRNLAENSNEYLWMRTVTSDGSNIKMIYRLGDGHTRGSDIGMKNNEDNFGEVTFTCLQLAQRANDHATAYTQYVQSFPPEEGDTGAGADENEVAGENATQCDVEGVGWFICPAMLFMANIVDSAYGAVANFLEVQPLATNISGTEDSVTAPLFQAWSFMRNFANVAFVIVFLVIIYSQITSVGISNYNIKKMLPRLVIAAVLVNVSYWICAVAVDISNILGYSIKDVFDSVSGELFPTTSNLDVNNTDLADFGGGWVAVTAGIIVGGAAVYAGLSVLLPMIVGAIISVLTALIILTVRQALIIILIVLSPLAFVAFLLPNTQSLFTSWRKLFTTLLLMFPLIGLIFGGSSLAGVIIQQNSDGHLGLQLLALGVTVIPLFITVFITKMLSMLGGLAGRLTGMVNDPTKGVFDRARKGAEGMRDRQQMRRGTRALNGGKTLAGFGKFNKYRRAARRDAARAGLESEHKRSQGAYVAEQAKDDERFRNRLAGGTALQSASPEALNRALAGAINVQASLESDEIKADHAIIKDANIDNDIGQLQKLAMGGTATYIDNNGKQQTMTAAPGSSLQTAAIQRQMEIGDIGMTDSLIEKSASMGVQQRQAIADGMGKLSGKARYYGGAASADVAAGKIGSKADLDKLVADSVKSEKWSAQHLANGDKDALTRLANVTANDMSIGDDQKMKLMLAANQLRTDPLMTKPDDRSMNRIGAIENGQEYTGP